MEINSELILRLEKLANLQLSEPERERLSGDLGKIVDMVNQLQEVNTDGVEPLVYLSDRGAVMRDDVAEHQLPVAAALSNAPQQDGTYFLVPKVSKK
jgi:aspartyl-tRNA(Asn)/glutamyl-tRNA(Gln) amidotransferase subunit C